MSREDPTSVCSLQPSTLQRQERKHNGTERLSISRNSRRRHQLQRHLCSQGASGRLPKGKAAGLFRQRPPRSVKGHKAGDSRHGQGLPALSPGGLTSGGMRAVPADLGK